MQLPIYISSEDYEAIALKKPPGLTTPQYVSQLLKEMAEKIRKEKSRT